MLKNDREQLVRVAWYYYKSDLTQEEIANRLNLNRARVAKILESARREGIVSFQVESPYKNCLELEDQLKESWKLQDAMVIPEVDQNMINVNLGAAGAQYLEKTLRGEDVLISLGYGKTMSHLLDHIPVKVHEKISLVTLAGGITTCFGNVYSEENYPLYSLNKRFYMIPAPLLASSAETAEIIINEPDVARIFRMAEMANMTFVGIGSMTIHSTLISFGYLTFQDIEMIRTQGAVGDILGRHYNNRGEILDIEFGRRLINVKLEQLKEMRFVVGVAGGDHKVEAMKGALRGGFLHALITDERTASMLLKQ